MSYLTSNALLPFRGLAGAGLWLICTNIGRQLCAHVGGPTLQVHAKFQQGYTKRTREVAAGPGSQLARGLQLEMAIDNYSVTAGEHRHLEAELADAAALRSTAASFLRGLRT